MIAKSIGLIGAGKMGEAIVHGLLGSRSFDKEKIAAVEVVEERRRQVEERYGIICSDRIEDALDSEMLIIAVKPDTVPSVARQLGTLLRRHTVISIAAGVSTEKIAKHLPEGTQLIRVMPNLACYAREGMVAIAPSKNVRSDVLEMVVETFSLLGRTLVVEEKAMDAITGIVGSGPAYIYTVIDGLADAGLRLGIPKAISLTLAAQTTLGAAKMVLETGKNPSSLRDDVATPGGTTIEGLLMLERGGLKALLIDAVSAAATRAREMDKG